MLMSRDTGSDTVEKFAPENMGIAVAILLLCALELEICLMVKHSTCLQTSPKKVAGTMVNKDLKY